MQAFAERVLIWFDSHGRHDLPWQQERSLYRVWVSEVMLQQTQVTTVIPYFERFMASFPRLEDLAAADEDAMMSHWQGLGYYSRARNLHRAARQIMTDFGGDFPRTHDEVLSLPGIGPSTAGAILAQALDEPHAILDGNVKRVLSRYHAIDGWSGHKNVERQLWQLAEGHVPDQRCADYTQALMDVGATICRRSRPSCDQCPLAGDCQAKAQDRVDELPTRRPSKALPVRSRRFLILLDSERILMEKRPPTGIWGGLWSLPEADLETDDIESRVSQLGYRTDSIRSLDAFRHTFSHYHLDITPTLVWVEGVTSQVADETTRWCGLPVELPVATPVRSILDALDATELAVRSTACS